MADTPDVLNQSPPFVDVDLFATDLPLQEAVAANGGTAPREVLSAFGRHWGPRGDVRAGRGSPTNSRRG